ncbi:MAG TPA: hypothetical protein VJ597_08205 [Sphingomicrobium sp.]|nr:hypothetical protein [Sphingomicrobium sp.]
MAKLSCANRNAACSGVTVAEPLGGGLEDERQVRPNEFISVIIGERGCLIRRQSKERFDRSTRHRDGPKLAVDPHVNERVVAGRPNGIVFHDAYSPWGS